MTTADYTDAFTGTDWASYDFIALDGLDASLYAAIREQTKMPVVCFDDDHDSIRANMGEIEDRKSSLLVCDSEPTFRIQLANFVARGSCRAMTIALNEHTDGFKRAVFDIILKHATNNLTLDKRTDEWNEGTKNNIGKFREATTIGRLAGALCGVPAIVVAAGPSLNKNMSLLSEAVDRAVICVVNTAYETVQDVVVPHFVSCIESVHFVEKQNNRWEDTSKTTLIASPHVHPSILDREWAHVVVSISQGVSSVADDIAERIEETPINACGSVANMAVAEMHALGCNPIVIVGADCAFTGGSQYATDNSGGGYKDSGHMVTSWGGTGSVATCGPLHITKIIHEEYGEILRRRGIRTINATEGGARISGWEEIPLEDVVNQLQEQEGNLFDRVKQAFSSASPIGEIKWESRD